MARPKLGGGETQRLHIMISEEELTAIDDWRFANRIPSRSEAVRRLVQSGIRLEAEYGPINKAAQALSIAGDALVQKYYLSAERPAISQEEADALRAYRKIMSKTSDLVEALASLGLQRDDLINPDFSIREALRTADETRRLFSGLAKGEDEK